MSSLSIVFIVSVLINGAKGSLSFDQCTKHDSYFAKSKQGIEFVPKSNGVWSERYENVASEMKCSSLCHQHGSLCQSAVYHLVEKTCVLSECNRITPGITYVKSDHVVYFERQKCQVKERYIALVPSAKDFADVREMGSPKDGIYGVKSASGTTGEYQSVLCQMSYLGGGWTVFQQRVDGAVSFMRDWLTYKTGFGSLDDSFWMGNDLLHNLTWSSPNNEILVELEIPSGNVYFPMYDGFKVGDEDDFYRLSVGNVLASGLGSSFNRGDGLQKHNYIKFSTFDKENDNNPNEHCSTAYGRGGWWYDACYKVYPNGRYGQKYPNQWERMLWYEITGDDDSSVALTRTRMMFRKKKL